MYRFALQRKSNHYTYINNGDNIDRLLSTSGSVNELLISCQQVVVTNKVKQYCIETKILTGCFANAYKDALYAIKKLVHRT